MKKYSVRITVNDPDDECLHEVSNDDLSDAMGDVLKAIGYGRSVALLGEVLGRMGCFDHLDEWEKRARWRWDGADKDDLGESAECQKIIDDFDLPFSESRAADGSGVEGVRR